MSEGNAVVSYQENGIGGIQASSHEFSTNIHQLEQCRWQILKLKQGSPITEPTFCGKESTSGREQVTSNPWFSKF